MEKGEKFGFRRVVSLAVSRISGTLKVLRRKRILMSRVDTDNDTDMKVDMDLVKIINKL